MISIAFSDNTSLNVTVGVLRDIVEHDALGVLAECNRRTRDNAAYPLFLHDQPDGWDVLLQFRVPNLAVLASPEYLNAVVGQLPTMGSEIRAEMINEFGGLPYSMYT